MPTPIDLQKPRLLELKLGPRAWLFLLIRRLLGSVFLLFCFSIFAVTLFSVLPVGLTPLMLIRGQEALFEGRPVRFDKDWVRLEDISPKMQQAVVAAEDWNFFEHRGFDFAAIEKAIVYNKRHKRQRGASTISQQVAKNLFLWPGRSWLRKGLEAYLTVLIEAFWSKHRIMEVYLNIVELGDGIYGVEAASQRYYGKSAKTLSASESALLAAILPNPRRFSARNPSSYVRFRQTMIQRRLPVAARLFPR